MRDHLPASIESHLIFGWQPERHEVTRQPHGWERGVA